MEKDGIPDVSTAAALGKEALSRAPVLALTIVSHPQAHRVGDRCLLDAVLHGKRVGVSRNAPDFVKPGQVLGAALGDPFISRTPISFSLNRQVLRVEFGETKQRRAAGAAPTVDHLEITRDALASGVPIELADRVVLWLHRIEPEALGARPSLGMIGASAGIQRVRVAIERIVDLDVPVLIRGETGTGKELVARAIHDKSPRCKGPFLSVNLGAIPRELAAAELFGAARGAYTGATRDREGLFRAAHLGTLFLDEVGEAPPEVQVMLLRALETGEIYPVGAERPIAVQVRLIAATDANLEDQIRAGRFKAPLLHRLAGYEIRVPALRERRDDIGVLFHHFARQELESLGELHRLAPQDPYAKPWVPTAIATRLVRHAWPGNIRQLRNLTRQLVIGSRGLAHLQLDPRLAAELDGGDEFAVPTPPHTALGSVPRRKPSDIVEHELLTALRSSAWDLKAAADRLLIPRPSIYDLIDRHPRIRTAGDLDASEIIQCFHDCGGDVDAMVPRLEVSKRALSRRIKELGLTSRRP